MASASQLSHLPHQAFIGIGSNLIAEGFDNLYLSLSAAVQQIGCADVAVAGQSSWYVTSAVPVSDQPDYLNAVLDIRTAFEAEQLLDHLQQIELQFGRIRTVRNAARTLDLDIISFDDEVIATDRLDVPHLRMHERKFVLYPLAELAANWRDPRSGKLADALKAECDAVDDGSQKCRLFAR